MAFSCCLKSSTMVKQRCIISSFCGNSRLVFNRNSTITPGPPSDLSSLVKKLLQQPLSSIKATLDNEDKSCSSTFKSHDFSWDSLFSALKSSSLQIANLVVEWRLEKFMKENEKNHDSYSELISLCGKSQNFETALDIFKSMEAQGLRPNSSVFNALLSACLSSYNFVTALSLFEMMEQSEDYESDSDTYNAFILAYANLGNKKAMQAWHLAKMDAGFPTDLETFESLILGCVNSRDFGYAERLYEEMILSGFIPTVSILQHMLVLYSEQKNVSKIREFMKFALNGSWDIDRHTSEKVVGLYYEQGRVEDMEELLVTLTNSNQSSEILSLVHSAIIRMYASTNRLDDVEYSVGRMLKQGISFRCPDDVEKVVCLYFRLADYDRLDLFLKCVKDSYKLKKSTCDLLVAGYWRAGLQEKLDSVINDMKLAGFIIS